MKNRIRRCVVFSLTVMCIACAGPTVTGRGGDEAMRRSMSELDAGTRLYQKGCYQQSLSRFFRAFELFAAFDRPDGTAMCLNNIGNAYNALNDIDTAILFYDEALATYTRIHDNKGMVHTLVNKATALTRHNRLSEARAALDRAEELAGQADAFPMLLVSRGILAMKQQHPDASERLLLQALALADPQNPPAMATIHFTLGELMMKTNRPAMSIPYFQEALRYDRQMLFRQGIAKDLAFMGDAQAAIGKRKEAVTCYKRSFMIYALMENEEETAAVRKKLEAAEGVAAGDMSMMQFLMDYWEQNGTGLSLCN